MKPFKCISLLIFIFFISACSGSKPIEKNVKKGINWSQHSSLSSAIDQAKAEDKLVFIDFYTDWCTPCKMMDQDVFSDKTVADYFNKNFVNLKVNCEKGSGPNLAFLYQIQMYPVLLFVDHKGREIKRKDGAAYHSELMSLAKDAQQMYQSGT